MKAAIYARKSNDDDREEENRSCTRQVERAKAYAESQGWTVAEEHVFEDDGVSGAEFKNRPGLIRMLAALEEFDCIICSEISRLGRDMVHNTVLIDSIRESGVRIFYYLTNEEEKADTPEQRLMIPLKSYAAEVERAKAGQRTRDALTRKFANGFSAGGFCYGYKLVPVFDPTTGERLHTDFAINEEEAEVIRGIFRMYVEGNGMGKIAKTLNGIAGFETERDKYFGGKAHSAPRHGLGIWGPTGIRAMLYRTRYIGVIKYGETKKVRKGGSAKRRERGKDPLVIERPELRIVPPDLWEAAQSRLGVMRKLYVPKDRELDRRTLPYYGRESRYLLSGIARCAECGGNITAIGGYRGNWYYTCSVAHNKGTCSNKHRQPMAELDAAVLSAVRERGLTPAAFDFVVREAVRVVEEELKGDKAAKRLRELEAEARKVQVEMDRFLALVAAGKAPDAVLAEIQRREDRLKTLAVERERCQVSAPDEVTLARIRRQAAPMLKKMMQAQEGDVPEAREVLRKILKSAAPLQLIPVERGGKKRLNFKGQITLSGIFIKDGAEERT